MLRRNKGNIISLFHNAIIRQSVPQVHALFFSLQTAIVAAAPPRQIYTAYLEHFEIQGSDQRQLEAG